MSIRSRFLLAIGVVVTLLFLTAFLVQTKRALQETKKVRELVMDAYQKNYEKKRVDLADFVTEGMAQKMAQINALLETIAKFPALSDWFAANSENLKEGTWHHAATLLQNDDWVQFLQNTTEDKLLSLIIPDQGPFFSVEAEPIQEGIAWIHVQDSDAYPEPCIGIELPMRTSHEEEISSLGGSEVIPSVYVVYTLEKFKGLQFPPNFFDLSEIGAKTPLIQGYEIDEEKFLSFLMKASEFVDQSNFKPPRLLQKSTQEVETSSLQSSLFEQLTQQYLEGITEYASELFLIWEATVLRQMGLFGSQKTREYLPDAMTFSLKTPKQGKTVFLRSILDFSTPLFNDRAFFEANPPKKDSKTSSGSSVFKSFASNQAFFVNTAEIASFKEDAEKKSLLTIGFELSDFLQDLVVTTGHYGCILQGLEVLVHAAPQGMEKVPYDSIGLLIDQQSVSSGIIELAGVEYFFMKIEPIPSIDLQFFFFLQADKEFSLFKLAKQRIVEIRRHLAVERIVFGFATLLILWFLLLRLTKKITEPLATLSSCLGHVKHAEWDLIKLPKIKHNPKDEIYQLVSSFQDMIEGMKEKQKMSGLLNKVVSKEIANEILKGEVHLGGEERVVTMLFTDIRGFTKMTQNMAPHDVIDLLNTCMTKLSKVIEDNKGVIDKYLGDGIMALYGAPISYKDSALCAVISAMEMLRVIHEWNQERKEKGLPLLDIGIGIHTGSVCAGNMGASHRLNYTVIGSHVNMASRLCYASGPGEILISADTYKEPCVELNIEVEDKGFVSFKGFDEKKQVYRVKGLKNKELNNVLVLEEGKTQ
jgi:class 3 adenylate cyclase